MGERMPIDTQKQIEYWRSGASEDWDVAVELVNTGRIRHGLFFAHLALEKMLKAHVCRSTGDLVPRIHALLRLAERTDLVISEEKRLFLARFDRHQLEGRYPGPHGDRLDLSIAQQDLGKARELFEWLTQQF